MTEAAAPESTATCTRAHVARVHGLELLPLQKRHQVRTLARFDSEGTQTLRVAARAIALVVTQGR
eukprot:6667447-Alexandrium_andersonii.AAC.1